LLLLLGTVGLLVTARIGLALLLAIGPIFVVMALFNQTRGLFVGWLKGMLMLSLAPLFAVVGGSIMLEMAVPILASLVESAGPGQEINQQAAMAFFVVGFVHCMLMLMAIITSSVMVSKWQVFGFASAEKEAPSAGGAMRMAPMAQTAPAPDRAAQSKPQAAAASARSAGVTAAAVMAANDTDSGTSTVRETKVYTSSSGGASNGAATDPSARTRGIGNRFRSASNRGLRPQMETSR
ncbi:MAG: type IV secretion system protein, partial [Pseudomonadota bacterium]